MHAVCSICGDIFTGMDPEVIHTTLCGHLFHYVCLDQWLQRSKTCPQCRSKVTEEKTVKLFFHISTYQSIKDSGSLENELQNVKFKLTLKDVDIRKLTEEKEVAKQQTDGLRAKLLKREEQIRNHETAVTSLQEQIKVLKFQMKSLTDIQLRAEELQKKLDLYRSVELILKGSAADTIEHLRQKKDKMDPTILCTCIETLKKEIEHYKKIEKNLQNHLKLSETKLSSALAEIDKLRGENSMVNRCFIKVKEDYKNAEEEIDSLKKKCKYLEKSINEGCNSSNTRNDAFSRLINEYPMPQLKNISTEDLNIIPANVPSEADMSPTSPDKLYGFTKITNRNKIVLNKRVLPTSSSSSLQCYDGLGGHVKEEQKGTDRAELFDAISRNKSAKLALHKRVKVNFKNVQKTDLHRFYPKKS